MVFVFHLCFNIKTDAWLRGILNKLKHMYTLIRYVRPIHQLVVLFLIKTCWLYCFSMTTLFKGGLLAQLFIMTTCKCALSVKHNVFCSYVSGYWFTILTVSISHNNEHIVLWHRYVTITVNVEVFKALLRQWTNVDIRCQWSPVGTMQLTFNLFTQSIHTRRDKPWHRWSL